MKNEHSLPLKLILGTLVVVFLIYYWIHQPLKNFLIEGHTPSSFENHSSQAPTSGPGINYAKPINPSRTDTEILQSIAEQNDNRDRISALLAQHASLTAQIRQQADAGKYLTVSSQSIPGPDTTPVPADIIAKLKSNQLIHH